MIAKVRENGELEMSNSVIVDQFELPDCNFTGSTAKLRRYYSVDFRDSEGTLHLAGTPGSLTDFCDVINCTLSGNTVTVPSFPAVVTLFNGADPEARETWVLFDESEVNRETIADEWFIPLTPNPTTREILEIANQGQSLLWPPPIYLNEQGVQALIDAQLPAMDASAVVKGITYLSDAPALAAFPRALAVNSPVIPAFVLHTSKYINLNQALTAIVSLGGGTVVVDSVTPLFGFTSPTVPANVCLKFEGQGLLTGTGTVTILGPFECPSGHRAFGGVTVTFAGNASPPILCLSWWGVTATVASDQAPAYQAALNALGDGLRLNPDVAGDVRIDSTLLLLDHRNVGIVGELPMPYADTGQRLHKIRWYGANGGTVLRIDRVRDSLFANFGIYGTSTGGSTGADIGMFITQDGSGSNISTNNRFEDMWVSPGNTRSGWIAAKVANTSGANNEQHKFRHCSLLGSFAGYGAQVGTGLYLGHGNVKEVRVVDCVLQGLAKGIKGVNASFYSVNTDFGATAIPFEGQFGDSLSSIGDHSEDSTQVLVDAGPAQFTMLSPRFSNLHGGSAASGTTSVDPIFDPGANSSIEVRGGKFEPSAAFTSDFILGATSTGSVTWKRNNVTISNANLITGLDTFLYSDNDVGGRQAVRGAFVLAGVSNALSGTTPDLSLGVAGAQYSARYGFIQGGATNVTNFLNGFDGQIIILEGDTLSTLVNGATLKTISGQNIAPWGAGKIVVLTLNGTVWEQIGGVLDGLAVAGGITSSGAAGIGYATGAGGTVTQSTNKATAVTLNKVTGLITLNNAALAAATIVSFVLNNSALAATDQIIVTHESGGTLGAYTVNGRATGAGTGAIDIRNNTAGSLAEAIVLRFTVIKSVSN